MNRLRTGLFKSKQVLRWGGGEFFSIEIWEHDSLSHVVQNMQIWRSRDIK